MTTQSEAILFPALAHPLKTDRLELRAASPADTETTWAFRQQDVVNEWLTGCPATLGEYRQLFESEHRLASTVVIELRGRVIGDFMLRREDSWAQLERVEEARGMQVELGWVLDPAYSGRGYATEAVQEMMRHSFVDLGVHRIVANCFLANTSSWRLMERLGMRREVHAVRESLHRSGTWLDTVGYAILKDEFAVQPLRRELRRKL